MKELEEFRVIKRLTGDNNGVVKNNCIEVDLEKPYDYVKPVVFCFAGNSSTSLRVANGFAKAIGNTVGIQDEVELISIKYRQKNDIGVIDYNDVDRFVDCFFLPLLQKDGRKLSIEQVKKNLRNITIITHCYGAHFVKYLNSCLQDRMLKLGFKEDKVLDMLKCVVHISYAPYSQNTENTNFYIKSINDKTFEPGPESDTLGELFEIEVKKMIEKLSPKEKKKYYLQNKIYLGNGAIFYNENFNLFTENLTGPILNRQNDHMVGSVLKNKDGNLFSRYANLHSFTASKCFALIIRRAIENSLENTQEFKKLDIKKIEAECNNIINKANASETEVIKREALKNSLEVITPEEAFKRMGITEKDFLEGKVNVEKINDVIIGVVDWKDSIYKKINWVYCNPSVCFRVYDKDRIRCTELYNHKEGIILENGELVPFSDEDNLENKNLALLNNGKSLINSIKYRIMRKNGKTCIALSDNYGSRQTIIKDNFNSQIKFWKENYKEDKFSVELTEQQKTVIKNLCTFFEIEDKNIRFKKEDGISI